MFEMNPMFVSWSEGSYGIPALPLSGRNAEDDFISSSTAQGSELLYKSSSLFKNKERIMHCGNLRG
jgi:hypothetical protein